MIELEEIRKLQLERIERQIEIERRNKTLSLQAAADKQKQKLIDAELDREKAEEAFPTVLASIECNIRENVSNGGSMFTFQYSWNVRDTYLVKMLLDVLPLHGYVCRLTEGKLEISW